MPPVEFLLRRRRRISYPVFFETVTEKLGLFKSLFVYSFITTKYTLRTNSNKLQQFNLQLFWLAWSKNWNGCPVKLQSNRPSRDAVLLCFRQIGRLINQAVISRVAIAVEKLSRRRRRRKQRDASTNQSNNFGVSRKRFKPSTAGSSPTSDGWGCGHLPDRSRLLLLRLHHAVDSHCLPESATESRVSSDKPRMQPLPPSLQLVVRHNFAPSSDYLNDPQLSRRQSPRRTSDSAVQRSPDRLWLQ